MSVLESFALAMIFLWLGHRWKQISHYLRLLIFRKNYNAEILRIVTVAIYLGDREPKYACYQVMKKLSPELAKIFDDDPAKAASMVDPEMGDDEED